MKEFIIKFILPYRWWYLGGTFAILLSCFLFYKLFFNRISPFQVIPESAGMIISIANPTQFFQTTDSLSFADAFSTWVVTDKFKADFRFLEKLLQTKDKKLAALSMTLGIVTSGAQTLDFLYVFEGSAKVDIERILQQQEIKCKANNFNGHIVFTGFFNHDVSFAFASVGHLLIAARYPEMVEDALSVYNNRKGIDQDAAFSQQEKQINGLSSDCRVFFNTQALPVLLSSFLVSAGRKQCDNLAKTIKWIGAGLSFEKDGISIDGNIAMSADNALFYALPENGYKEQQRIMEVLPASTATLFWLGPGDFKKYYNEAGNDDDFSNYIAPWIGEEAACAITEPLSATASSEIYAVFRIKDSLLAKSKMSIFEKRKGLLFTNSYNTHFVKQIKNDNILHALTGQQIQLSDPFYSFVGNYVIFCSSRAALELSIDKYLAHETLSADPLFLQFIQNFNEKSSLFFYLNMSKIEEQLKSVLNEDLKEQLDVQLEPLARFNFLGLQLYPEKTGFNFKGKWKGAGVHKSRSAASFAWKFLLDSEAISSPVITRSEDGVSKEVFIQDKKYQIYIIDGAGNVRIKKLMEGPILSDLKQIDFFKSGKLYYLFNTAQKIHLLDSKGNEVLNFPITLQSPATAGLLASDFDGSGSYHFFVPVKNGNIYGFENTGKPMGGWNPRSGVGLLTQPMKHFQTGDKDFILALSDKNLTILKKNGDLRMSPIPVSGSFLSPPAFQNDAFSQRIVVMNSSGMATNVNLEGTAFNLALGSSAKGKMRMLYADVSGDGKNEYITLDANKITCKGYQGEEFVTFFEKQFKDPISEFFVIKLPGETKSQIGVVSKSATQIYLINGAGKLYRDFPLAGTTPFEITDFFGEGIPALIVANGSSVYIYKLR